MLYSLLDAVMYSSELDMGRHDKNSEGWFLKSI